MSELLNKLQWRYATKKMNPTKVVAQDKVERILEAINLAPTSSGLQPFEVFVVTNPEVKAKLSEAAYGQAQVADSSHVLVFAAWDNYSVERIDAVVAHTHADVAGSFECSSPLLNDIFEMSERSARQNVQQGIISVDFREIKII